MGKDKILVRGDLSKFWLGGIPPVTPTPPPPPPLGESLSTVASAPVKNASSFSSKSDNSLGSRACLAICKANSNPKFNLALKDHSKFHFLPVSIKPAKPMSVSNSCVSSTL